MNDKELCAELRSMALLIDTAGIAADRIEELLASQSTAVAVAKPKKADIDAAFEVFWQAGMRKMKKTAKARPAFERAIPKGCSPMEFAEMLCRDVAERLRICQTGFEATHPTSYLNGMGWEDEIKAPVELGDLGGMGIDAIELFGLAPKPEREINGELFEHLEGPADNES